MKKEEILKQSRTMVDKKEPMLLAGTCIEFVAKAYEAGFKKR